MKNRLHNKIVFFIFLCLLIAAAIFGAALIKKFIGYATYIPGEAGYITEVVIDHRTPTYSWQGYYGFVFMVPGYNESWFETAEPGGITLVPLIVDCLEPNIDHEIYATTVDPSTLDWSSITAANPAYVDSYYGIDPSDKDSVTNTFTGTISVEVGSQNITDVPATYTNVFGSSSSTTFDLGILNVSNDIVFVAHIATITKGFNDRLVNYQMIVPAVNTTTYYFFTDPNDVCPEGISIGVYGNGSVVGYVADNSTGNPLGNVTISISGVSSLTDANGFYNLSIPIGTYHVIGIKNRYDAHIGKVNVSLALTTYHNFTMTEALPAFRNGTILGNVTDNSTNLPITNATVSVAGVSALTDSNGFYNITTFEGTHNLVAIKDGYDSHIASVNITANNIAMHNIVMEQTTGTIRGVVINSTGSLLPNVTMVAAGISTLTNATGRYSLTIPKGTTNIVAIKEGYSNYTANVTIYGGNTTEHNITMNKLIILINGTLQGTVIDNSTNLSIANVVVSIAGRSVLTNANGFYNVAVLEGKHNIVATKERYENYIGNVTVYGGNITIHNITMNPVIDVGLLGNGTIRGLVKTSLGNLLSGVTISIAGRVAVTNTSGNYSLEIVEGTHNIVATKSGYDNYIATVNVTVGEITEHDITMHLSPIAGLGAGAGTGQGAGAGTGQGAGTGIKVQRIPKIEKPKEIVDHEISVKRILKKLRAGTYIEVPVTISNYRGESVALSFSIDGDVTPLIKLDKKRITVETGQSGEIKLTIFGYDEGIYSGSLVISGDIDEKIPIDILVYSKEKLPVEALVIRVTPSKKKVSAGENFKYRVDLQNMLTEEKYIVSLSYSINGVNNNKSIFLEKEDVLILTSFSVLKSFVVPDDLEPGDYTLDIKADYLDLTSMHKTQFTVVQPLYKYSLFGIIPLWIIFILIGVLSTGTFSVIAYKRKAAEKRRYKTEKIDYSKLTQPGPRSAFVGNIAETDIKTYFDLDQFQVHTLVAGASGSGKTVIAQDLVEEALFKKVAVIVFDPTAQWTGFLRRCEDKKMLSLYKQFGMKKTSAAAFNGNVYQVSNPREIIDIKRFMKPGEINIFVTNKLDAGGNELFVANTIREVFHANLPESKELILLIVYDGIHSLLPKFGGSGEVFVQVERAAREFRKWGVGLILLSQVLGDFPPEVLANINTQIQTRTRDEKDLIVIKEEYGEDALKSIIKSTVGTGMVENSAYNNGKPYFVSFRPLRHSVKRLSDKELEDYNKYNAIIEDLDYQVEQLEKEGIDVFDLRLELKLSQDKVKSGNFNMVNIYLDGLTPRVKSQWEKLGKKPKKRELKLVSEEDLKAELEKAREEKKKREEEKQKGKKAEEESEEAEAKKEFKKSGKEIEKEESKSTEISEEKGGEGHVNNLIRKTYSCIENGDKEKAVSLYSEIKQVYRKLPKSVKARIFSKCVDIQKRLAG